MIYEKPEKRGLGQAADVIIRGGESLGSEVSQIRAECVPKRSPLCAHNVLFVTCKICAILVGIVGSDATTEMEYFGSRRVGHP